MKSNNANEKSCWSCDRVIDGKSKLGLCPVCTNNYGTPVAGLCIAGLLWGGRLAIKNSDKIIKGATRLIKRG